MRKAILVSLVLVIACTSFKSVQKDKEPIIYLLPEVVEKKALEHIKEMTEFKGKDSINFYAGLGMYNSSDTFLLTISTYYKGLSPKSNLHRLIKASNRFIKIGNMQLPILYMEDYKFSNIVNTKNADGSIGRAIASGKYYSIVFTGRSYEIGNLIWYGWAGG